MGAQSYRADERTVVAQALAAHRDAVDFDEVEAHWDEYGPARQKALADAGEFIALFDVLTAIRRDAGEQPC
jgi:hypothetical protein